jgi:uncharacterized protein (TIGR03435 family)
MARMNRINIGSNVIALSRCSVLLFFVVMCNSGWCSSANDGFEVASVKLSADQNPTPGNGGIGEPIPSGTIAFLTMRHVTLRGLLMRAYLVRYSSIVGPSWIDSTYYDVVAKVPAGARGRKVADMLQTLISERFAMRVRWEAKIVNGWVLVATGAPLKVKRTSLPGEPTETDPGGVPTARSSTLLRDGLKTVSMTGTSMLGLANAVWGAVGEPVQDSTGLKGAFDVTFESEVSEPASFMSTMSAASVRRSLHNYGLDIVRQKVEMKLLRVDSATKIPKAN